ncbi:class I SAM-dependent methyltransferase [Kitasatospora sp. NPDC056076]|uniref:class I SAM-dependent methyltransferase n=1 Tax=Kitasatospora sp. NPDC056076 TaxID=3345703 RepID=UPI0035E04255
MTTGPDLTDAVAAEYTDLNAYQARLATHRLYSRTPDDPEGAVRDALQLPGDGDLLDIGCGPGGFLHALVPRHRGRLVGIDTSTAAVSAARTGRVEAIQASAEQLPFGDGAFAIACARHMLYHLPDPGLGLFEAHRVLRAGGTFAATVNHAAVAPHTQNLLRAILQEAGITPTAAPANAVNSDNLPAMVEDVFGNASTVRYDNALVLPGPGPLATYARALLSFVGIGPDHPAAGQIRDEILVRAQRWFTDNKNRTWDDPKGYVVVTATR